MREGARRAAARPKKARQWDERPSGEVKGNGNLMAEVAAKFKPQRAISYSARSKAMPRSLGRHQMGSNCDVMFSLRSSSVHCNKLPLQKLRYP